MPDPPIPVAPVTSSSTRDEHEPTSVATNASATNVPVSTPPPPAPRRRRRVGKEHDGNQGWCIVVLVFLTNFLVLGFFKSLGMLTKILNKEFNATMHVYILMCIIYSLNCATGPLACYLTRLYSARSIALVGTSMISCGLILSWFAKSLIFLYFSVGVLTGVGSGLTYPTGVILVGNYFVGTKSAGLANVLILSGSPIGGMIMPYVVSILSEHYTSRGALLICGGIILHSILCVRAYRPPRRSSRSRSRGATNISTASSTRNDECPPENQTAKEMAEDEENKNVATEGSSGVLKIFERELKGQPEFNKRTSKASLLPSDSKHKFPFCAAPQQTQPSEDATGMESPKLIEGEMARGVLSENGNLLFLHHDSLCECEKCKEKSRKVASLQGFCWKNGEPEIEKISGNDEVGQLQDVSHFVTNNGCSHVQPAYILSLDHSCMILCSKSDLLLEQQQRQQSDSLNNLLVPSEHSTRMGDCGDRQSKGGMAGAAPAKSFRERFKEVTSPLRNPIYVFLLLSNSSTAISATNIHLMISHLVEDSGEDYTRSSLVYLLISGADLSGRLLGAFLADRNILKPVVIYALGLVCSGICCSVFATLSSFLQLCILSFAFGLFFGLQTGIYGFLLTEFVGRERIHLGYGISMLLNGTLQLFAILLVGNAVSKYKNSFTWLAPLFGCILVTGGVTWSFGFALCRNLHFPT